MSAFEIPKDRDALMRHIGDLSQMGGVKRYTLTEGRGAGVDAVDFETGSGLNFTVLPGRGMDIAWTKYKGVPISYISKTGIVGAAHYDPRGMQWLRSFFAGMVTTCGLSNAGDPCTGDHPFMGEVEHGLHGRISNTPAYAVSAEHWWDGDVCRMRAAGTVRESSLHTENITLRRTVETTLGAKSFTLTDVISNEGFITHPLMLLYHINVGWPMIGERSRLVLASKSMRCGPNESERMRENFDRFEVPGILKMETSYTHKLMSGGDGFTTAAVINDELNLAFRLRYRPGELPCFNQWKQMNAAEYVLGLEPGVTFPLGLAETKKSGHLEYLEPGQVKTVTLEFGVADGAEEIAALEADIAALR